MHVLIISTLLFLLPPLQTWRYFLLVHAITGRGWHVAAAAAAAAVTVGGENTFLVHHATPEHSATSDFDAFQEQQQQQQHYYDLTHTSDSSVLVVNAAENSSSSGGGNSFGTVLRVDDVTSKSIKVRLESKSGSSAPPVPHKIFFKNVQRNSDWKHYVVDEKRDRDSNGSLILTNLLCGNKYQIYGANIDREGQTSASDVLLTKTAGREPLAPPASVFLTRVNRTSYRLNLSSWSSGGCPILGGTVEYRSIRQRHWTSLPLSSLTESILLNDLSPDELYKVRVSMKNSAGSTSIEYEIRSSDSKNIFQKNPSEVPNLISLSNFHSPVSDMEGPGHVTDVLIVTLTLLLTTLAAVAILYRTIQRKVSSAVESRSNRVNSVPGRAAKSNFVQNNVTCGESFAMQPSELSTVTLEKRFQINKLTSSASDSGFTTSCHIVSSNDMGHQRSVPLQYLTTGRRTAAPIIMDEYAVIQKRDTDMPRYSAPVSTVRISSMNENMVSGGDATEMSENQPIAYCDNCGYAAVPGQEWECMACDDKTPSALLSSFRHHQMTADRL